MLLWVVERRADRECMGRVQVVGGSRVDGGGEKMRRWKYSIAPSQRRKRGRATWTGRPVETAAELPE